MKHIIYRVNGWSLDHVAGYVSRTMFEKKLGEIAQTPVRGLLVLSDGKWSKVVFDNKGGWSLEDK